MADGSATGDSSQHEWPRQALARKESLIKSHQDAFKAALSPSRPAAGPPSLRVRAKSSRVIAPGMNVDMFNEFWHASLALTKPDPDKEPPPKPDSEPELPTPESSDLSDELSDEEDEQLTRLLEVMPDLTSPGGVALAAMAATRRSLPGGLRPGSAMSASAPTTPSTPSTATTTLLRLARLNRDLSTTPPQGSMVQAMFSAARAGAEMLNPHSGLKPERPSTPLTALSHAWSTSTRASIDNSLLPGVAPGSRSPGGLVRPATASGASLRASSPAATPPPRPQSSSRAAMASRGKQAQPLVLRPSTAPRPVSEAPAGVTVRYQQQEVSVAAADPHSSANARMVGDFVDAAKHAQQRAQAQAAAQGAKALALSKKDVRAPAFFSGSTAPRKKGGPAGPSAGAQTASGNRPGSGVPVRSGSPGTPGKRGKGGSAPAPPPPVVDPVAAEEERLERRVALEQTKRQILQNAVINMSPLKAKSRRPVSTVAPGAGGASGGLITASPRGVHPDLVSTPAAPPVSPDFMRSSSAGGAANVASHLAASISPKQPLAAPAVAAAAAGSPSGGSLTAEGSGVICLEANRSGSASPAARPGGAVDPQQVLQRPMSGQSIASGITATGPASTVGAGVESLEAVQEFFNHRSTAAAVASASLQAQPSVVQRLSEGVRPTSPMRRQLTATPPGMTRQSWTSGGTAGMPFNMMKELRVSMEQEMLLDEALEEAASGAYDKKGEVGRLLRRYYSQPSRQVFNLQHSIRGIDQVSALADVLLQLPDVSALLLGGNDLSDAAIEVLAAVLSQPAAGRVQQLDLSHNKLSAGSIQLLVPLLQADVAPGPMPGIQGLPLHAHLGELVLCGNASVGDVGIQLLASAVKEAHCCLRLLDISHCQLTERAAAFVGSILTNSRSLLVLDASWNSFGLKGSKSLADGICATHTVKELYLAWTGIGDQGAAHIVAGLRANDSLNLLDLSGNHVSADTCMVLVDALQENQSLGTLIMRDNPLGQAGAKRLMRAMHKGTVGTVDLLGCTFQNINQVGCAASFNPNEPDGEYELTMANPAHMQIAVELLGLAAEQGPSTWKNSTLNGRPWKLKGFSKLQLPDKGTLKFEFVSKVPVIYHDDPITDQQFRVMWQDMVLPGGAAAHADPYAITARAKARRRAARLEAEASQAAAAAEAVARVLHDVEEEDEDYNDEDDEDDPLVQALLAPGGGSSGAPRISSFQAAPGLYSEHESAQSRGLPEISPRPEHSTEGELPLQSPRAAPALVFKPSTATAYNRRGSSVGYGDDPVHQRAVSYAVGSHGGFGARYGGGGSNNASSPSQAGSVTSPTGPSVIGGGAAGSTSLMGSSMSGLKGVTDEWKFGLLNTIVSDFHLASHQLRDIIDVFHDANLKVEAVLKGFGVLSDPENLHVVCEALEPHQAKAVRERVGQLSMFSPANPTGSWSLVLSHPVHAAVAKRLLVAYIQQYDLGLTKWPYHMCFTLCTLDGKLIDMEDPHKITLPKEGTLKINFVDLRPIPELARPLTDKQLSALINMLIHEEKLDPLGVVRTIDNPSLTSALDVVSKLGSMASKVFGSTSHVAAMKATAANPELITVRDQGNFLETMRMVAVNHYMTCDQLMELLSLLPYNATAERVELCTTFWARTTDKRRKWTDVMRRLAKDQQVRLTHRLGVMNVFNPKRPAMHYRLRMYRLDEHEIAWQLFNLAVSAPHSCFLNLHINDVAKNVNEGPNMWALLRGNCQEGTIPQTTIEFDFDWPEFGKDNEKVVTNLKQAIKKFKEQAEAKAEQQQQQQQQQGAGQAPVLLRKGTLLAKPLRLTKGSFSDSTAAGGASLSSRGSIGGGVGGVSSFAAGSFGLAAAAGAGALAAAAAAVAAVPFPMRGSEPGIRHSGSSHRFSNPGGPAGSLGAAPLELAFASTSGLPVQEMEGLALFQRVSQSSSGPSRPKPAAQDAMRFFNRAYGGQPAAAAALFDADDDEVAVGEFGHQIGGGGRHNAQGLRRYRESFNGTRRNTSSGESESMPVPTWGGPINIKRTP